MTGPSDTEEVLWALRFGWYLAESRGRMNPAGPKGAASRPTGGCTSPPVSDTTPFLLRNELDNATMCAQALGVIVALAAKLDDDERTDLADLARQIKAAPGWPGVDATFADLDRGTQEVLTARSDSQACAYLLGRGLAECYWAQDRTVGERTVVQPVRKARSRRARARNERETHCWAVLTEARRNELSRMMGRMAPYFNRYTAPAVAGTLAVWYAVGCDPEWRLGTSRGFWGNAGTPIDIDDELYRQVRRWYELLVLGQDPSALIRASALLRSPRATWTVVRSLAFPLVGAAIGLALLALFATFQATGGHSEVAKVVTASLGIVGVTVASVMAKAKAQALKLLTRTRDDAYTDLVTVQILTVTQPRRRPFSFRRKGNVRDKKLTVGG